uniref:Galactosylgalactosylxylosylprotein 3-beta-glucuronosyltransferase n=2 Tax=Parascaris univalens TaxID=6257 RepID=A0A915BWC4_PARUN
MKDYSFQNVTKRRINNSSTSGHFSRGLCAIFTRKMKWLFFILMIILVAITNILLLSKPQRMHPSTTVFFPIRRRLSSLTQQQAISICNQTFYHLHSAAFNNDRLIIVITPTYKRFTRIPDLIRLSQTLMHISKLAWLVIEDGKQISDAVYRILQRSNLTYCYFAVERNRNFPARGWTARQFALRFVLQYFANFSNRAVVYFADDDNTYDVRIFDKFIRKVEKIGVWAVGTVANLLLEAPSVNEEGKVNGWLTKYAPGRSWAIDMAGFAINLELLLQAQGASFVTCKRKVSPEPCLLSTLNITKENSQAFGYDENPRDILVWHTKSNHHIHRKYFKMNYEYLIDV